MVRFSDLGVGIELDGERLITAFFVQYFNSGTDPKQVMITTAPFLKASIKLEVPIESVSDMTIGICFAKKTPAAPYLPK
jgi:hypothetical protein